MEGAPALTAPSMTSFHPPTHPPARCSFPAAHVLMRLEQAAAGSWPEATGVPLGSERVLRAMGTACRGSFDAVVRVYESLLR